MASPPLPSGPDGSWWRASDCGSSLTPWDIAALRFGVAGLLLLPYVMRKGIARERLGWIGSRRSCRRRRARASGERGPDVPPAAHAGALFPGVMPLMVALLAAVILHEPFTAAKKIGFVLILCGVFGIAWAAGGAVEIKAKHRASAVSWLCSGLGLLYRRDAPGTTDGLHAAAIAAVGALVLYMPIYLTVVGTSLAKFSLGRYRTASLRAGNFDGDRFTDLLRTRGQHPRRLQRRRVRRKSPAMTAVMAIPVLGEWPTTMDWIAIARFPSVFMW